MQRLKRPLKNEDRLGNGAMRYIVVLVGILLFASPLLAEAPCDFKGISVGNKMSPAGLMSALGVTEYKTDPARRSFDQKLALAEKYGLMAAGEIEDEEIGPYCTNEICRVPYGVAVGNNNSIPVKVDISFHEGLITEIVVQFSESNWDDMLPIFDQKYGADWTAERSDMPIINYQTKERRRVRELSLNTSPRARSQAQKTIAKYGQQTSTSCSSTTMHLGPIIRSS